MCTSACYYDTYRVMQFVQNAQNYSTAIIPSTGSNAPLAVAVSVYLVKLLDLTTSGTMSIVINLLLSWNDPRMAWNQSLFNNVEAIQLSPDQIWTPKLALLNSVSESMMIFVTSNDSLTRLDSNGTMMVAFSRLYKVACSIDLTYFPFDTQSCNLHFYYEDLSGYATALSFAPGYVDSLAYKSIGEFQFINATLTVDGPSDKNYNYSYFNLVVTHDRNPSYYVSNVGLPVTFLIAALAITLILPSDNSVKITMACSLTVALYVLQQAVSRMLPATARTPLLAKGMVLALVLGLYSLACSIVTVTLFAVKPALCPCVERFVDALECLLRCRKAPKKKSSIGPLPTQSCYDDCAQTKARAYSGLKADLHDQATMTDNVDRTKQQSEVRMDSPDKLDELTTAVKELVRMKQSKIERARLSELAQKKHYEHTRRWKTLDFVINITAFVVYVIIGMVTCIVFVFGLPYKSYFLGL